VLGKMQRMDTSSMEKQIIELLETSSIPCSITYIAQHLHVAWATARTFLLNLVIKGKIKSQKTTSGQIFWINSEKEVMSL
jgi:predicted ArsR family transcriptional regulator